MFEIKLEGVCEKVVAIIKNLILLIIQLSQNIVIIQTN